MILPTIYGQGAVFAASGLDAVTDHDHSLVGTLLGDKLGFLLHTQIRSELWIHAQGMHNLRYACVSGDVLLAHFDSGDIQDARLLVVFVDAYTIVGRCSLPAAALHWTYPDEPVASCMEHVAFASRKLGQEMAFALCLSLENQAAAETQAQAALDLDIDGLYRQKLAFYERVKPSSGDAATQQTYAKAFSVLKANVMSAQGQFPTIWTTPDRVPHRHLWLWDSVFHAIGWVQYDADIAYACIDAVLQTQREDGMIPFMSTPFSSAQLIQPPILAWGVWILYQKTGRKDFLERAYAPIGRFLHWVRANCDSNGNGLFEWTIEDNVNCRSGESGADNSARFDKALPMDAVDFSCFWAADVECMAQMAGVLELTDEQAQWNGLYAQTKASVNQLLWHDRDAMYYDRFMDGERSGVKSVVAFFALYAGICTPENARQMIDLHLCNAAEFGTPLPFPADAVCEPTSNMDMWRGSTWVSYTFLVLCGLARYGYVKMADEYAGRMIDEVVHWYGETGCLFEFYDSTKERPPSFLRRKGISLPPYDIARKYFPIRDFGWTASLFVAMVDGVYR